MVSFALSEGLDLELLFAAALPAARTPLLPWYGAGLVEETAPLSPRRDVAPPSPLHDSVPSSPPRDEVTQEPLQPLFGDDLIPPPPPSEPSSRVSASASSVEPPQRKKRIKQVARKEKSPPPPPPPVGGVALRTRSQARVPPSASVSASNRKRKATTPASGQGNKKSTKGKGKKPVIELDSEPDAEVPIPSDSDDEGVVPPSASKGTEVPPLPAGYKFMPIFRDAFYAKFWDINREKIIIVDRPAREFDLRRAGVFECIFQAKLLTTLAEELCWVKDVIMEFYSNLSLSMFDISSPDYHRGFVRGQFFNFSPSLIDVFVCGEIVQECLEPIDANLIAATLLGKEGAKWPVKAKKLRASSLTPKYKALYYIANRNWVPTTHKTYVNFSLATLLYKVGQGLPVSFGRLVFEALAEHAEKVVSANKAICFPRILYAYFRKFAKFEIPEGAKAPAAPFMRFTKAQTGIEAEAPPFSSKADKASSSSMPHEDNLEDIQLPFGPAPPHYEPVVSKLMFQAISLEYDMTCEQIRMLFKKKEEIEKLLILAGGTQPGGAAAAPAPAPAPASDGTAVGADVEGADDDEAVDEELEAEVP